MGWDRFSQYYGTPWKNVVIAGAGDPTGEEINKIIELGYYSKIITPSSLEKIKNDINCNGEDSNPLPTPYR